jgi:Domain of unknown function (DUF4410)
MKGLSKIFLGLVLLAMLAVSPGATAAPVANPNAVYISDFDFKLGPAQQSEQAKIPKPVPLADRLGYGRPRIPRTPEQRARDLVALMSRSLLDDLHQAGIPTQRLPPGAPLPSSGWLVRGAFLQLDVGGELRQAVTGFGNDATQIEVVAAVDQLGAQAPQPLYTVDTAQGGKFSDAAVTLNPYLALGRFVLMPRDLERNVKATAADIADEVKMQIGVGTADKSEAK